MPMSRGDASRAILFATLLGLLAPPALSQTAPTFGGTGMLPGALMSEATGVSSDGSVVVGNSGDDTGVASDLEAFRLSGGTLTGLGFLDVGESNSEAAAVSADGSVVVGSSRTSNGNRGFRWTSGSGLVALGTFNTSDIDREGTALSVSANGLVAVGSSVYQSGGGATPVLQSARWPNGNTSISDLGDLPGGGNYSIAWGASQTGSVIVGIGDTSSENKGWWWAGSGQNALVGVPGAISRSGARAISADGSTIVGFANSNASTSSDLEAVRWTGGSYGTIELLGALPGAPSKSSEANAVSDDGSIIVGRARNASNADRAFLWDAVGGMRALRDVIELEYGLPVGDWVLEEALAVSHIGPNGEFTVVGRGKNPNGDTEGFIAYLITPACSDGIDNDGGDGADYPTDPECTGPLDFSETVDCNDGVDNDNDGEVDSPDDPECTSTADQTELADCGDGFDNDGDGLADYPLDPGCESSTRSIENPECNDGIDNDGDLAIDYGADLSCTATWDLSENADCNDGLDNDLDGDIDYPAESGCDHANDQSEAEHCSDNIDNDFDGKIDYPEEYPDCVSPTDNRELPQCSDGVDNDGDGDTDLADSGCGSAAGRREDPVVLVEGHVLVADRVSGMVFTVDPVGGAQSLVSNGALMQSPQGIAVSPTNQIVIADPSGLVELTAPNGLQRLASDPLVPGEGLQVVWHSSGDLYVLEESEISQVTWSPTGIGAKSTWFTVPTPEAFPTVGNFAGDSLAEESSGDMLITGLSLFGDSVFRIDAGTAVASVVTPGLNGDLWVDLALEADGDIIAVGNSNVHGPGVFVVDPVSGTPSPLSTGAPWQTPTGVAVAEDGQIWVADAGACAVGSCVGGKIVRVDPGTGTPTTISTGGFIAGEMDVAFVPEPGHGLMLLSGLALLRWLGRRRGAARFNA